MPRLASILGLGFGDCGKGVFTDALCRRWGAHTVVRFNGGAQAGHNVVLPDGRHHTFSQFGAGSFIAGVATILAYPVVVHPAALLVEHTYLQRAGVADALSRLMIDARCRINTPFHQAAGRLRELRRSRAAHGSCGVGVGETVQHALQFPEQVLHYADLQHPAAALEKLELIRQTLAAEWDGDMGDPAQRAERGVLNDAAAPARWLAQIAPLTRAVPPAFLSQIAERMQRAGTVLFEGAQGVLLDEWRGFHPHTTWSSTHAGAVEAVAADAGVAPDAIAHFGVLRSYLTRHGPGPFPTEDAALNGLDEPHNTEAGWQGRFRRGHPDAVLLRYAQSVAGRLDGILLSHLDVFDRGHAFKPAHSYEVAPQPDDATLCRRANPDVVTELIPSEGNKLAHQAALTHLLATARPLFDDTPIRSAQHCIAWVEAHSRCPVRWGAFGNTHEAVRLL